MSSEASDPRMEDIVRWESDDPRLQAFLTRNKIIPGCDPYFAIAQFLELKYRPSKAIHRDYVRQALILQFSLPTVGYVVQKQIGGMTELAIIGQMLRATYIFREEDDAVH